MRLTRQGVRDLNGPVNGKRLDKEGQLRIRSRCDAHGTHNWKQDRDGSLFCRDCGIGSNLAGGCNR